MFPSSFFNQETEIDSTINQVKRLNQEMSALAETSSTLAGIDIAKTLAADSKEYKALTEALTAANKAEATMAKYTTGNAKERTKILGIAKEA